MGEVVQRHTTVTAYTEEGEILSATLEPGDEMPDWAPDSAKENELLYTPPDGAPVVEDEETGTTLAESGNVPADYSSPTANAGYEDPAEAEEERKAERKAAAGDGAEANYENMNKDQLSALLEERQLPKSGNRQELIERLEQSDAENG